MEYNEFKSMLAKEIKRYLPEDYQDAKVEFLDMKKLGKLYEGMTIRRPGQQAAPALDVRKLYEEYENADNKRWVLENIAESVAENSSHAFSYGSFTDYNQVRDRLFIRLSNAEANSELLETVPNTRIEDLAVTYHVRVDGPFPESLCSFVITNDLLKAYGITADQLHEDAVNNSPKIFPPTLRSMRSILMDYGEFPAETGAPRMYVMSNEAGLNGAASLMYRDALDTASEFLHGDLVILPSSIHETILLKDDGSLDYETLQGIVEQANRNVVSENERLSDHIYRYDSASHEFSMVKDLNQSFSDEMKMKENALRIDLS